MPSLLEKVKAKEAIQEAKKDNIKEKIENEKKEATVKKIAHNSTQKDKQISAKVNETVYDQFTAINKRQGLSNNSALNMLINKYVRENKGILEE